MAPGNLGFSVAATLTQNNDRQCFSVFSMRDRYYQQRRQQTIMGSMNGSIEDRGKLTGEKLVESLQFYEDTQSEQFGPIQILKQTQKPYRYVMVYSENGIADQSTMERMGQKLEWYRSFKAHPHIVDIEAVRLNQKSEMCIKKVALEVYTKYYNYTLDMAITRKLKRNCRFKEADFFYVLASLLDIWKHIDDVLDGQYIKLFNLSNVFVTPEGYVKMYPFPIDLHFVSSPLRPSQPHSHNKSFLHSEEVLMELKIKSTEPSTSVTTPTKSMRQLTRKDNLRDIGLIMFQLVLLNKEVDEILQFSVQRQQQLLQQLEDQQFISWYLKETMLMLLSKYKETSYQEVKGLIDSYKSDVDKPVSNNLKLEEGPEYVEPKQIEKTYNLRRLSEHKNLKTGIISIMSKKNSGTKG